MKNKSFLTPGFNPIVGMIQYHTARECRDKIARSLYAGAEAIGLQLEQINPEERTDDVLTELMKSCQDKPVYITSYRGGMSAGYSDDECAELLLRGLKCGATLCDVIGDYYDNNDFQITLNPAAVAKQRELISRIHDMGGEVLISTHDMRDLSGDDVFNIALLQAEHGADIIKIVVKSEHAERIGEYAEVIQRVRKEINKPFLFLDAGACANVTRKIGVNLGTCMYLCVQSHGPLDTSAQPTIKCVRTLREEMKERIIV